MCPSTEIALFVFSQAVCVCVGIPEQEDGTDLKSWGKKQNMDRLDDVSSMSTVVIWNILIMSFQRHQKSDCRLGRNFKRIQ